MTMGEAIRELIERVEAGECRPFEIEEAAMKAFPKDDSTNRRWLFISSSAKAYEGSLDAAKALHEAVLPGWAVYSMAWWPAHPERLGQNARIELWGTHEGEDGERWHHHTDGRAEGEADPPRPSLAPRDPQGPRISGAGPMTRGEAMFWRTGERRAMRPMSEAPRDGTPVLVKIKDDLSPWGIKPGEFGNTAAFAGLFAVMRNHDDIMDWCFAAPVGRGGFSEQWLEGWWPLPAPVEEKQDG